VSKTLEQLLMINIVMAGVFVVGTALALLWGRTVGGAVDRDEKLFIVKMFAAIWAATNVMYFIMR
jgi:hypothetical protein